MSSTKPDRSLQSTSQIMSVTNLLSTTKTHYCGKQTESHSEWRPVAFDYVLVVTACAAGWAFPTYPTPQNLRQHCIDAPYLVPRYLESLEPAAHTHARPAPVCVTLHPLYYARLFATCLCPRDTPICLLMRG